MNVKIVSGEFGGRKLEQPYHKGYRPTSNFLRSRVFDIIGPWRIEHANFLDLCAGSGAMGFEALSRGAGEAVFVEKHSGTCKYLEKNIEMLGVEERTTVLNTTWEKALELLARDRRMVEFFDFAFFDPPYDDSTAPLEWLRKVEGVKEVLRDGGELFIETPRVSHKDDEFLLLGGEDQVMKAGEDGAPEVHEGVFALVDERITGSTNLTRWRKRGQVEMLEEEQEEDLL